MDSVEAGDGGKWRCRGVCVGGGGRRDKDRRCGVGDEIRLRVNTSRSVATTARVAPT
jgi:hypothetical protein